MPMKRLIGSIIWFFIKEFIVANLQQILEGQNAISAKIDAVKAKIDDLKNNQADQQVVDQIAAKQAENEEKLDALAS